MHIFIQSSLVYFVSVVSMYSVKGHDLNDAYDHRRETHHINMNMYVDFDRTWQQALVVTLYTKKMSVLDQYLVSANTLSAEIDIDNW